MSYLIEWVTNIILFILLATVIDMLLPNSNMQKYTKLVIGLLLIAIVLTPIFKLMSANFETTLASIPSLGLPNDENVKNSIDSQKNEIQASDDAYILDEMAVQLKKGVAEELMNKYGLEIDKFSLSTNANSKQTFPDNLQKVSVLLIQADNGTETVEAIKPVTINIDQPPTDNKTSDKSKEVAAFLAKQWSVDEKIIKVSIEGGPDQSDG